MDRACLRLAQPRDARKELKNLFITTAAVALAAALDAGRGRGGDSGGVAVVVDEDDGSGGGSCDNWLPFLCCMKKIDADIVRIVLSTYKTNILRC